MLGGIQADAEYQAISDHGVPSKPDLWFTTEGLILIVPELTMIVFGDQAILPRSLNVIKRLAL